MNSVAVFFALAAVVLAGGGGGGDHKNCPVVQGTCSLFDGYKVTSFNGNAHDLKWFWFSNVHPLFDAGDMAVFTTRDNSQTTHVDFHCGSSYQKFQAEDILEPTRINCNQGSCTYATCYIVLAPNSNAANYALDVQQVVYAGNQGIGGECYVGVDGAGNCPHSVDQISDNTDGLQPTQFNEIRSVTTCTPAPSTCTPTTTTTSACDVTTTTSACDVPTTTTTSSICEATTTTTTTTINPYYVSPTSTQYAV